MEFIDLRTGKIYPNESSLDTQHYWKSLDVVLEEFIEHKEAKSEDGTGLLKRRRLWVDESLVKYIGKESDNLNEPFGLDEFSYEFYDDPERVDREFKENTDKILNLEPKDVTEFGINRTTLWTEKEKIKKGEYDKITDKIKIKILSALKNN